MSVQANSEEKDRRFICTCEKSYLSYAALFTHIKQKHGGKAPGPIVRPRSQNKRGRPRKVPNSLSESNSIIEAKNIDQKKFHEKIKLSALNILHSTPTQSIQHGSIFSSRPVFTLRSGFRKFEPEREDPKISESKNNLSREAKKQLIQKSVKTSDITEMNKLKTVEDGLMDVLKELSDELQLSFLQQKIKQIPIREKFKDYQYFEQEKQFNSKFNCYAVSIGKGIAEFSNCLKQICKPKDNFEVSTLILLFLQYIQQQQQGVNILIDKKIYQMDKYAKRFLEEHLDEEIHSRGIQMMGIFKGNNPINILLWFFKWLAAKEYSYFKVEIDPKCQWKDSSNQEQNVDSNNMKEQEGLNQDANQHEMKLQDQQKIKFQGSQQVADSYSQNQQNGKKSESEQVDSEQKKEIATLE